MCTNDAVDAAEGEGWLLTYVYNHFSNKSYLAILDAQDVESGPVGSIEMPQRVPFGFHGVWVPNSWLSNVDQLAFYKFIVDPALLEQL